jgi:hypothetical protein
VGSCLFRSHSSLYPTDNFELLADIIRSVDPWRTLQPDAPRDAAYLIFIFRSDELPRNFGTPVDVDRRRGLGETSC